MFPHFSAGLIALMALIASTAAGQTADPAVFERVLVPVSVNSATGAYGSIWATELWYRNNSTYPVVVFPLAVSDYVPTVGLTQRLVIFFRPAAAPGEFLYVTRGYAGQVQFDLRLYNRADPFGEWGTKLPVVWENEFAPSLDLINVGCGPEVRAALRIYALADDAASVTIRIYSNNEVLLASGVLPLQGTPRYAAILSLADAFPAIRATDRVRIHVESPEGARLWAFAAITSNVTQHVSVATPY
jgi:hypothetical protein